MPNTPRDDFGEFDNPTTPGTPSFRDEYPPASSPAYAPQTPQYEQGGSSTTPFRYILACVTFKNNLYILKLVNNLEVIQGSYFLPQQSKIIRNGFMHEWPEIDR